MTRRLLIAGCGDLGRRLAARIDGWDVTGLRRDPAALDNDRDAGRIRPVAADLTRPASLDVIAGQWDAVVYTATPSARTEAGYRSAYLEGLAQLASRVATGRLLFVSSTAVYGQDRGERVAEDSPTEPNRFNGRILLQAERLARSAGGTVVRFSGIYGPGRDYLLRRVRAGPVPCRRDPPVWTNRIHAEDCAGVLAHLLELPEPEAIYVASDACPAPRWDVLEWLAGRLGVPGPVEIADPGAGQGKRVVADRLRASGFELQYPDYRSGYGEMIRCG